MKRKLPVDIQELTRETISFFTDVISPVYRRSFEEELISNELVNQARQLGLPVRQGKEKKNVIIYKGAGEGCKDVKFPVILQAHMDMVCVPKPTPEKNVFEKGVKPYFTDDNKNKMKARSISHPDVETSLGADDGIGVAVIFSILKSNIAHPPVIAILTVEEEDGMGGATKITFDDIAGIVPQDTNLDFTRAKLINIDDERDGIYSVSCAGSLRGNISLPIIRETATPKDSAQYSPEYFTLSVSGLTGGHSGICIHEGRANANVILCDVLQRLIYADIDMSFFSFGKCGEVSNAIPSLASAVIAVPAGQKDRFGSHLTFIEEYLKARYKQTDPGLKIEAVSLKEPPLPVLPYSASTLASLLYLVRALPDGAFTWFKDMNGNSVVETSSNLGIIKEENENAVVTCMIRSSVDAIMDKATKDMTELSRKNGAKFKITGSSPGWIYKDKNILGELFLAKYRELFSAEAVTSAIHAGLECGHFARVLGNIDMIACGPTLSDVHDPKETLYIDTVSKLMALLAAVLENISDYEQLT
jgi:dipeptidase D